MEEKDKVTKITKCDKPAECGNVAEIAKDQEVVTHSPVADIIEQADKVVVNIELPGVAADEICIDVEDKMLKITADSPFERHGRKVRYVRSFQLSDEIDTDGIAASCRHGLLQLSIPRAKSSLPRKIKVECCGK